MALPDELKSLLARPMTIEQLGIPASIAIDLVFRLLFNEGEVNVARFADVLRLHPQVADSILTDMQREHLVEITKAGSIRLSYTYRLTEEGAQRARDSVERTQYVGPVPVGVDAYSQAIEAQTATSQRVAPSEVKRSLSHLILPDNFHRRIGPAINAGSSLFLYGPPGNGKTTVAQAIAKLLAGTDPIWLPYTITIGGQIIQIIDPLLHHPVEVVEEADGKTNGRANGHYDKRWGLFKRPAVMVGGELTMEALELRYEPIAKFYEAPLQLKANGGMFLIDDFGRQQISPHELLNRWIVPLESRFDFLRLQSGQTLKVPFRQLIVFSTNLDPTDLVDGAFMRRIQMKVEVGSPDQMMFYQIFARMCQMYKVAFDKNGFMHLLQKWYAAPKRVMQAVHPRDIIKTVVSICDYEGIAPVMSPAIIDEACRCYFVEQKPPNGVLSKN